MMTVSAISSSGAAASYYEKSDDYYSEKQQAESEWTGNGAAALGLDGKEVDQQDFKDLLDGKVEGEQLGTKRGGEIQHRAGVDLTFSAPKSVSIQALAGGDDRLVKAHDEAVKEVLSKIESEHVATRIRSGADVEKVKTDSMVAATFRHEMSREQDPQLHTHSVVMNMTKTESGKWRSVENRALFKNQKDLGLEYRQALAEKVRELGYQIEQTNGKDWSFKIKGVDQKTIDHFSSRSQQVEAALAERGKTRETASAAEKEVAALDSRKAKGKSVDRPAVVKNWQQAAKETGSDLAKNRDEAIKTAASSDRAEMKIANKINAHDGVTDAMKHLAERNAAFTKKDLEKESWRFSEAKTTREDIKQAIEKLKEKGELVGRTVERRGEEVEGFTTAKMIVTEKQSISIAAASKDQSTAMLSNEAAAAMIKNAVAESQKLGHSWTSDQKNTTASLLTSTDRVQLVQGAAGTAKTSTVLRTYAAAAKENGEKVVGLAPTNSAKNQLGKAAGIDETKTVARFLLQQRGNSQAVDSSTQKQTWVVDEASMLSSKDMNALLKESERQNAKLVLVGDKKQLSSVGAGNAFSQLQDKSGLKINKLENIVRQKDGQLRQDVLDAYAGKAAEAIRSLEGRDKITQISNKDERISAVASRYASKDAAQRDKSLIVAPLNKDRQAINSEVQSLLKQKGEVGRDAVQINSLKSKGLTNIEKKIASSYEVGDRVRFSREMKKLGIEKNEVLEVTEKDGDSLKLEKVDGTKLNWSPAAHGSGAGRADVLNATAMEFSKNDKVVFTAKDDDHDIANRESGQVIKINKETGSMTVETASGQAVEIAGDASVDLAYAQTGHAAQGQTFDSVDVLLDSNSQLSSEQMMYVGLSRAEFDVNVTTDNVDKLIDSIEKNDGQNETALEKNDAQHDTALDNSSAEAGNEDEEDRDTDDEKESIENFFDEKDEEKEEERD